MVFGFGDLLFLKRFLAEFKKEIGVKISRKSNVPLSYLKKQVTEMTSSVVLGGGLVSKLTL